MTDTKLETRSERVTLAVTPTEKSALELIAQANSDKYEGPSVVLRDYTPEQAVQFVDRLRHAFTR